jgi:hypothetical protein
MSHSSHVEKRKKRSHLTRNLFVLFFLIVIALIVGSLLNQSNQVPSISSTASASTNGPLLTANDFNVAMATACGYQTTNGFKFLNVVEYFSNNRSMAFHFLSAKIVFLNYTLTNGTVVTVNRQWTDNNQTFATTSRKFNFIYYSQVAESGPKLRSAEFIITANIQELPEPFVETVTVNVATINC